MSVASVDVYKCFDQLVRPLLTRLAARAGMPLPILHAYEAFQDNLTVFNQIAGELGQPHQHRCSIPQGCPFSMLMVALIMKPWLGLMRTEAEVVPRILADDLFLHAARQGHAARMVKGMRLSMCYFQDISARIAPGKCFVGSSCPSTRANLRRLDWGGGMTI